MMRSMKAPTWMALLAIVSLLMPGCGKDDPSPTAPAPPPPPEHTYEDDAINEVTDVTGRIRITSSKIIPNEVVSYELTTKTAAGAPVKDLQISYDEVMNKSLLFVHDPAGTYVPVVIYGTPGEISSRFGSGLTKAVDGHGEDHLVIPVELVMVTLEAARVTFTLDSYQIQDFYMSDVAEVGDDYIMYCKTWDEIAGLIQGELSGLVTLSSVITSFGAYGQPGSNTIAFGQSPGVVLTAGEEELRDHMISQAADAWAMQESEVRDGRFAVKVYPFHEERFADRLLNNWAAFVIERDNPICGDDDGSLSGRIVDATNGAAIEGVTVTLSGTAQRTTATGSDGTYSFADLPAGPYAVTAEKDDYITEMREASVAGSPVVVNIVMSPTIHGSQYRIVLTWGTTPRDLDSHLWVGDDYHVYYSTPGSSSSPPYAELDRDHTDGEGPETITIHQLTGPYKYAVHNFTGTPSLTASNAIVRVYTGSQLVRTFTVPTSGSGLWWYVFDMSPSGAITSRDYLTDTPPGEAFAPEEKAVPEGAYR